ncbi:MAG: Coenzyme F420 hydrogenase/dehydrogenase, beta subunit C-terminal domain [Oscillospiraceae bacterium]
MICEQQKCTGCFACLNICPTDCISMAEDATGHIYPQIDENKCINCNACRQICPAINKAEVHMPTDVYAAWSLDETEHKSSTSGGIAAYLTRKIIEDGGIVYGCSSDCAKEVKHIRVDNPEDAKKLKGSKYVQSFINETYRLAKQDLDSGKKVMFIGTPCQISGLKAYLKKSYPLLTTVDLICHGVPPQKLLFEHLNNSGVTNRKTISFRDAEGHYLSVSNDADNIIYRKHQYEDLYYLGFGTELLLRESCYNCDYAQTKRCSDITIGDFWGLGEEIPFKSEIKNGVSVIMINTPNGQKLFDNYKSGLFYEKRTLEEALKKNPNLRMPSAMNANRAEFLNQYPQNGFEKAVKISIKKEISKYKLLQRLQRNKVINSIIKKLH